jgi:monoamine oxidase
MRCLFPSAKEPFSIVHYGMLDWSREPYESGVHLWKPGYKSYDVIKTLKVFGENKNVHIGGETFSDYQGFIEGCLRTIDGVMESIVTMK